MPLTLTPRLEPSWSPRALPSSGGRCMSCACRYWPSPPSCPGRYPRQRDPPAPEPAGLPEREGCGGETGRQSHLPGRPRQKWTKCKWEEETPQSMARPGREGGRGEDGDTGVASRAGRPDQDRHEEFAAQGKPSWKFQTAHSVRIQGERGGQRSPQDGRGGAIAALSRGAPTAQSEEGRSEGAARGWRGVGTLSFPDGGAWRASAAWGSECRAEMVSGKQDRERCRHRRGRGGKPQGDRRVRGGSC